jgi:glycine/D-amino acid oxidase-like deaminating enzyme
MASYWLEERGAPLPRTALAGAPEVEIVGGGVTGCSCALALAEAGVRVRLHEAREIAGGASGRNGGFALRGGAMAYDAARMRLGRDSARAYWQLTEQAQARLASLAGDAFRALGSLRLAVDEAERSALRAEFDALVEDGFGVGWVDADDLAVPLRGRFAAGLLHPPDGAIQPARWVRSLARRAAEAGAEVREGSRVGSLGELEAERVVVATDGLGHGLVPELDARVRATRGQVLVTESLPKLMFERPHYARYGLDYWHQTRDRRLVIGGSRDAGGDDEWTDDESVTDAVQSRIETLARELLGRAPRVTHRWAGIWGTTEDLLPLVGQVPGSPRVWVAAGYSGHGNVLGFASGELVARALGGDRDQVLDLLDPARAIVAKPS